MSARSCITCHRRKIRCDKKRSCSSCMKSSIPCIYTATERHPRKLRKTTISDVSARLVQLENSLKTLAQESSAHDVLEPPYESGSSRTSLKPNEVLSQTSSNQEMLMQIGGSLRYFNEALLSRIIEEVCHIPHHCLQQSLTPCKAKGNSAGSYKSS
jgi:hypothetical protein